MHGSNFIDVISVYGDGVWKRQYFFIYSRYSNQYSGDKLIVSLVRSAEATKQLLKRQVRIRLLFEKVGF